MPDSSPSLQERLDALRVTFASHLPERLTDLAARWERIETAAWNANAFIEFHRAAHSLVGSSGTYGFAAVSRSARNLETYLKGLLPGIIPPSIEQRAQIHLLLRELLASPLEAKGTFPGAAPAQAPAPPAPQQRVLFLFADDGAVSEDLARQLGYFGYDVNVYSQAASFNSALSRTSPEAVIVDAEAQDSATAVVYIDDFQETRDPRIAVLYISDYGDMVSRLKAVRHGARGYLLKPVDVPQMVERLDSLAARQAADPFRILIIEDSEDIANLAATQLSAAGMITHIVADPMQVTGPMREFRPDLVLMDLYMPGCTGLELAAVIRQQPEFVSVPIVFLSSETDAGKQMAAMQLGGDDFLMKPIERERLISSVTARAGRSRILRSYIRRDGLTGLLNHSASEEQLEIEISRACRQHSELAYALLDLDNFKTVNDTYGHTAGDAVLKGLARVLQQRLRKTDVISRYGGEELVVILPESGGAAAVQIMESIRSTFSQIRYTSPNGEFSVTFSCGIAVFPDFPDGSQLSAAADRAMYQAKRRGRNQTVLAEGSKDKL